MSLSCQQYLIMGVDLKKIEGEELIRIIRKVHGDREKVGGPFVLYDSMNGEYCYFGILVKEPRSITELDLEDAHLSMHNIYIHYLEAGELLYRHSITGSPEFHLIFHMR